MNIKDIQASAKFAIGRSSLLLKKYSPEILLYGGIAGMIGAGVLGARATLKAQAIVSDTQEKLNMIEEASKRKPDEYGSEERTKDLAMVYTQSGLKFAKLYAPAIGMGVLSVASILSSHGIMKERNVSMIAAYNLLATTYENYRGRIKEKYGDEEDKDYHMGLENQVIKETQFDDEGKKYKTKEKIKVKKEQGVSVYAKFFDEYSAYFKKDPALNLHFLRAQQNYANDILNSRGHIFLNEVYDMLGLEHTSEGQLVGWVKNTKNSETLGDNFVNFDIYSVRNKNFVNARERAILLDFNVDGVIYDLI
jgi:hypothetical protein